MICLFVAVPTADAPACASGRRCATISVEQEKKSNFQHSTLTKFWDTMRPSFSGHLEKPKFSIAMSLPRSADGA